jgi:DNA-binding NarL/FixJ family response regulator
MPEATRTSMDGRTRARSRHCVHDITERKLHERVSTAFDPHLIHAREEERARLARKLHDDLGQSLAALELEIDRLARDAEGSAASELALRLRGLSSSVIEVAAVARDLSHTLHPVMLQQVGLAAPIEATGARADAPELTPRQVEVLRLLGQGHTMKEAAATLGLSPRTVAFHKYRIMEVLSIRTNAALIRYAFAEGLAPS